jgi:hypothetical protein
MLKNKMLVLLSLVSFGSLFSSEENENKGFLKSRIACILQSPIVPFSTVFLISNLSSPVVDSLGSMGSTVSSFLPEMIGAYASLFGLTVKQLSCPALGYAAAGYVLPSKSSQVSRLIGFAVVIAPSIVRNVYKYAIQK